MLFFIIMIFTIYYKMLIHVYKVLDAMGKDGCQHLFYLDNKYNENLVPPLIKKVKKCTFLRQLVFHV